MCTLCLCRPIWWQRGRSGLVQAHGHKVGTCTGLLLCTVPPQRGRPLAHFAPSDWPHASSSPVGPIWASLVENVLRSSLTIFPGGGLPFLPAAFRQAGSPVRWMECGVPWVGLCCPKENPFPLPRCAFSAGAPPWAPGLCIGVQGSKGPCLGTPPLYPSIHPYTYTHPRRRSCPWLQPWPAL